MGPSALALVVLGLAGYFITCNVRLTEMNKSLSDKQAQLSALQRRPIFITKGSGLAAPSPESVCDCVRAINEVSLPVEGCFELAFVDGFSFSRDGEPRIGLVAVNPEDGSRCLRPAGEFLTGLIRNRGVTEEMCSNYGVQEQA